MPGTTIKAGATVQYSILAENSLIEENAYIGEKPENMDNLDDWGVAVVGANINVKENAKVLPKEQVAEDKEVK